VLEKIYIEQESQDTASQPPDNCITPGNSRRQKSMEGVGGGMEG